MLLGHSVDRIFPGGRPDFDSVEHIALVYITLRFVRLKVIADQLARGTARSGRSLVQIRSKILIQPDVRELIQRWFNLHLGTPRRKWFREDIKISL